MLQSVQHLFLSTESASLPWMETKETEMSSKTGQTFAEKGKSEIQFCDVTAKPQPPQKSRGTFPFLRYLKRTPVCGPSINSA